MTDTIENFHLDPTPDETEPAEEKVETPADQDDGVDGD